MPKQARLKNLDRLDGYLADFAATFPEPWLDRSYYNFKLPAPRSLVRAEASARIKARCAQALIDAAAELARTKPLGVANSRVVAVITLPDMFDSEVCVFFDEAYFKTFVSRSDDADQTWTPLPAERSLAQQWDLTVPVGFTEKGFHSHDEDRSFSPPWVGDGEVWLIGDVLPRS